MIPRPAPLDPVSDHTLPVNETTT